MQAAVAVRASPSPTFAVLASALGGKHLKPPALEASTAPVSAVAIKSCQQPGEGSRHSSFPWLKQRVWQVVEEEHPGPEVPGTCLKFFC